MVTGILLPRSIAGSSSNGCPSQESEKKRRGPPETPGDGDDIRVSLCLIRPLVVDWVTSLRIRCYGELPWHAGQTASGLLIIALGSYLCSLSSFISLSVASPFPASVSCLYTPRISNLSSSKNGMLITDRILSLLVRVHPSSLPHRQKPTLRHQHRQPRRTLSLAIHQHFVRTCRSDRLTTDRQHCRHCLPSYRPLRFQVGLSNSASSTSNTFPFRPLADRATFTLSTNHL